MANDKNKQPVKPTRVTPQRPATAAGMPQNVSFKETLKKHRSTFIILGVVLLLVIVWVVSSYSGKKSKYDVYMLNSELSISDINEEYRDFIQIIANHNESIGNYFTSSVDIKDKTSTDILAYYDELLYYEVPEGLISVKAAELDLLNLHYKYINGANTVDSEIINESKVKLSAAIAHVVK